MKTILAFTTLIFAALTLTSEASHAQAVYNIPLAHIDILSAPAFQNSGYNAGEVVLDIRANTVTLTLSQVASCPTNSFCRFYPVAPLTVVLPVTSATSDTCAVKTIVASSDLRAQGGNLQYIAVRMNAGSTCGTKNYALFADTAVEYDIITANGIRNTVYLR